MRNRIRCLIGATVLAAISAGVSEAGIVKGDQRASGQPPGRGQGWGLQQILDYISEGRGYSDRETAEHHHLGLMGGVAGGAQAFSPVVALPENSARAEAIWAVTSPALTQPLAPPGADTAGRPPAGPQGNSAAMPPALIYLEGGFGKGKGLDNFASDRPPHRFDPGKGTLAAVPEPAPILLLGTILLATFSIARLRFNR